MTKVFEYATVNQLKHELVLLEIVSHIKVHPLLGVNSDTCLGYPCDIMGDGKKALTSYGTSKFTYLIGF